MDDEQKAFNFNPVEVTMSLTELVKLERKNTQLAADASTILAGIIASSNASTTIAEMTASSDSRILDVINVDTNLRLAVEIARKVRALVRGDDS